ncbi:MAG: hypothetical protein Q7W30_08425 [Coriobacteriia bacterium]|nr:hypothetical protein [Coriobacteriia bacterium]
MSLQRALERLPGDRGTEAAIREVLELMRIHVRESLSAPEVARRLERPEPTISVILSTLADGYVLRTEDALYRYEPDALVDLDVQRYLRRVATHSAHVQQNVAKFRDRYGYR